MKKKLKRYHFTQVYQKSWSYAILFPDIWHMTDVVVVFPFRLLFTLLPSKQPKKWKFQKTEKKHLEISFYRSAPKIMIIICYTFREIWCMMDVIVIFHFGLPSLYTCVPKIMIRWCTVPETWCMTDRQTNRWMDRWKKWHMEVGAPPKKF